MVVVILVMVDVVMVVVVVVVLVHGCGFDIGGDFGGAGRDIGAGKVIEEKKNRGAWQDRG